jgi:beta-glucosidase/6-phospho-beta-glucosidase/beta-galactosidase
LPKDPAKERDLRGAGDFNYLYAFSFLDAIVRGLSDEELDGAQTYRGDLDARLDYLGVNYYATVTVEGTEAPLLPSLSPLTRFDIVNLAVNKLDTRGIYLAMRTLAQRYPGLPVIITENNVPFDGLNDTRPRYLVETLTWLHRAMREGAPVKGYFYWSLMDNYEWNLGTDFYTGLYAVDPHDPQKRRVPRPEIISTLSRIASERRIPKDLLDKYPTSSPGK